MTHRCSYCCSEFEPSPFANNRPRWCSQQCRREDWRLRQAELTAEGLLPDDIQSPNVWDGLSVYSRSGAMTHAYESRCLPTGHLNGEFHLTNQEARQRVVRGLGRCVFCGGSLFLEQCLLTTGRSA